MDSFWSELPMVKIVSLEAFGIEPMLFGILEIMVILLTPVKIAFHDIQAPFVLSIKITAINKAG